MLLKRNWLRFVVVTIALFVIAMNRSPRNQQVLSDAQEVEWWQEEKPLLENWPYLKKRNDIFPILEKLQLKTGVEVGVQRGRLAWVTLRAWKSCVDYKLVDLWGSEENYKEPGKENDADKQGNLRIAKRQLKEFEDKVEYFVMRLTEAAKKLKDEYFDYIYIDARHDYCAVLEDLESYWPKLKKGGIFAGHDYVTAQMAIDALGPLEDWSKCENGTVEERAVLGAVDDFASKRNLKVVTTHEGFDTWLMQKPYEDD